MDKLILVRHSETEGQHEDSPLTKSGVRQAQVLANFLDQSGYEIDHIISSPFLRAIETIKPFALSKGLSIKTDERLEERILSHEPLDDWEEVLHDTFKDPELKFSGGESSQEAKKRILSLVDELEQEDCGNVLLVTHGNLLALLLQKYNREIGFYEWKRLSNPDMFLVQKQGGEYMVERIWQENY
ncbi:2,3-bisphosphoglycerate-dependent phosphoglycerate mutase [Halobacillus alkaliphilus]|uniref:Phosphoglycerate mutase family protein n=2 Tax=Halobacillus TaxID=45667 RepID=I0JN28_HALH3|nr:MULTISPECIES: histidine phosphatase family protein [Halobacillus]ASF39616.1 histidine phosphatase family protein [Halobacillus halophilus]CCG45548.1 phosphoglycerate mutase family protein [Halobacillus halophilus DSM 2266]SFF60920.1 2,3-bisphosphoglycerate-dependent phosphoglycerate mutase [Halobacillus alkaliphilus]